MRLAKYRNQRIPHTHRYRLTSFGLRVALFSTRPTTISFGPDSAPFCLICPNQPGPLRRAFDRIDLEINAWIQRASIAALKI
jgi:hypothetical protein